MENMTYQGDQFEYDDRFKSDLEVTHISDGDDTDPAWTSEIGSDAFLVLLKRV